MAHDDDIVDVKLVHSYHQAADYAVKLVKGRVAGDLDDLRFAAAQPHGRLEEVEKTRIHAGQDGQIAVPDKPGLGIEIDEEACLAHPYRPHTLRHYNGELTQIRPAQTAFYF